MVNLYVYETKSKIIVAVYTCDEQLYNVTRADAAMGCEHAIKDLHKATNLSVSFDDTCLDDGFDDVEYCRAMPLSQSEPKPITKEVGERLIQECADNMRKRLRLCGVDV